MRKAKMMMVIPMLGLLLPLVFIIGTVTSITLQEGMDMKTTFLVIITMLGFTIPLMWLVGTLIAMVYFYQHRVSATSEERTLALHPQLGVTMADGGDSIEKKEKDKKGGEK
jgi:ABC-type antimicrobial peptide transport system permease subunit